MTSCPKERVYICSANRRNASTTLSDDFYIDLRTALKGRYSVHSVVMYNTFYNIRSDNNTIYFYENATSKSTTITAGIYNGTTLATAMKTAMDTASGGFNTFTITYSETTGKFTFAGTSDFHFEYGSNTSNSIANATGFYASDGSAATSQVSDFVANLQGIDMVALDISSSNYQFYHFGDNLGNERTTVLIPNTVDFYGSFSYFPDQANPIILNIGQSSIKTLHFRIRDAVTGSNRSLNGSEFHIVLTKEY